MTRHSLDLWPIDQSIQDDVSSIKDEKEDDNIRVFIPLDINREAVLRRIKMIITKYGEANEENELSFLLEIEAIVAQIEIYDQVWFARTVPPGKKHSVQGTDLIREVVAILKEISDGCAEIFPFELIDRLESEYGLNMDFKV
ncbi:hypothetical protein [Fusibacter tunisiensis]|jgi:hypothetical protein|uniref:Uncharacterized protein n=1 Tax=Fusibacter tunisiensis TaxID=1008308 RepID=A0ABS2MNB5_9FIRM|nr:hypothetical protein [Fusibacter tunisiensis]MBM7560884.1 hypothetical protein [Fusibacter tunisiensis]